MFAVFALDVKLNEKVVAWVRWPGDSIDNGGIDSRRPRTKNLQTVTNMMSHTKCTNNHIQCMWHMVPGSCLRVLTLIRCVFRFRAGCVLRSSVGRRHLEVFLEWFGRTRRNRALAQCTRESSKHSRRKQAMVSSSVKRRTPDSSRIRCDRVVVRTPHNNDSPAMCWGVSRVVRVN